MPPQTHTMEDFTPGQVFRSKSETLTADAIIAFARQFDPQPFHTDPEKARDTAAGTLIASGWHTACASMRLMVDTVPKIEGGMLGRAVENMHWPRPVYPGDTIRVESTVAELRPSSKPGRGVLRLKNVVFNQRDDVVLELDTIIVLPRKT
jgi:acyl dehydratase